MQYIVESILNYVQKENTNYAILVNGKWGSGKTYFWENVLKGEIEKIEVNGKKLNTIYVSLYGITSIEEINKRIVLDNLMKKSNLAQKIAESKWSGKLTELAKMTVGVVKSLEIPVLKDVLDTKFNYENLLDFSDTVLCFDDLERANLDITDILGYINNFVEHDGVKVIIISNEDEISDKLITQNIELKMLVSSILLDKEGFFNQDSTVKRGKEEKISVNKTIYDKIHTLFDKTNEYKRIKEKLIGKTLTFTPDYPSLIEEIVNQISNEKLKNFLIENLEVIISTFKDSGTENIRILKQALDDFELVYLKCQEKYSHLETEILPSVLKFILAASFEIKSGAEGNEELENVQSNEDFISAITWTRLINKNEKSYLESFKQKYFGAFNIFRSHIFFKFAELLVRKGIFNSEVFEKELNDIVSKTEESIPLHEQFLRNGIWDFSDEEFFEVEKQTYEKLINGEVHFPSYFRAFALYRYLIDKGLVKKEVKDLKNELMSGLNIAAKKAENYEDMDSYFLGTEIKPDDHDLKEFKEKIIEINQALKHKQEEKEVQELMETMTSDFHKFLVDMQDKYFYLPVFSYYNVNELFKKILSLSNSDTLSLVQLLEKRYRLSGGDVKLYLDLDNLKLLRDKIDEYVSEKKITPKIVLLKELSATILKISATLEELVPKKKDEEIKDGVKEE
jgi:hypothetical protein